MRAALVGTHGAHARLSAEVLNFEHVQMSDGPVNTLVERKPSTAPP